MNFIIISGKRLWVILVIFIILCSGTIVTNKVIGKEKEGIKVPIIMYHSILKATSNTFTISPKELEEDFEYIKEQGFTTITMCDLINYVYDGIPLPEKPIIITFDDGYYNNYTYVFPLLEKYDMKAVVSIIGTYTERYTDENDANTNYGYFRWIDISRLLLSGTIEFQNHSYNMHTLSGGRKGTMKKYGESIESYIEVLTNDLTKLQTLFECNCSYTPTTFTYPFGFISKESTGILKNIGFKASLTSYEGINYITKDPDCLFLLKRYNRSNKVSTKKFFNKIFKLL